MLVQTLAEFKDLLPRIREAPHVGFDVETTGLEVWKHDRLCGIGLGLGREAFYLPYRHPEGNLPLSTLPKLWSVLSKVPRLSAYNLKFDMAAVYRDGYRAPDEQNWEDVLVMARLCDPNRFAELSLKMQTAMHLGAERAAYDDEFKAYLRKNKITKHFDQAPADIAGPYCCGDIVSMEELRVIYDARIAQTKQHDVWSQEQELTRVLFEMERVGIGYDVEYGVSKIPGLRARIREIQQEIFHIAGKSFNPNSGKQLAEVMESLGLKSKSKSEKTGAPSWGVTQLLAIEHPIGGKLLEMRGLSKVLTTYFRPIVNWPDGVVHGSFKNWGTVTGRLSSGGPNMQNIAKTTQDLSGNTITDETLDALYAAMGARQGQSMEKKSGGIAGGLTLGGMTAVASQFDQENEGLVSVRRLFIPREGFKLYMLDYTQMEIRVFADYVRDPGLTALLEDPNFDFHSHVAKEIWHVDESSDLWDFYRTLAKAINFGLIYGIGIRLLATQIQKTMEEAKEYKTSYFARFPKAQTFMDLVMDTVEGRGWIKNRFGRRYWIEAQRSYVGINYLIQGSSADIVKNRMIAVAKWLKENQLQSRMMVQVHDEVLVEIADEEESFVPREIKRVLEERQIETFLPVEISMGMPSWAQKEKCEGCEQCSWFVPKKFMEEHVLSIHAEAA